MFNRKHKQIDIGQHWSRRDREFLFDEVKVLDVGHHNVLFKYTRIDSKPTPSDIRPSELSKRTFRAIFYRKSER